MFVAVKCIDIECSDNRFIFIVDIDRRYTHVIYQRILIA